MERKGEVKREERRSGKKTRERKKGRVRDGINVK